MIYYLIGLAFTAYTMAGSESARMQLRDDWRSDKLELALYALTMVLAWPPLAALAAKGKIDEFRR